MMNVIVSKLAELAAKSNVDYWTEINAKKSDMPTLYNKRRIWNKAKRQLNVSRLYKRHRYDKAMRYRLSQPHYLVMM